MVIDSSARQVMHLAIRSMRILEATNKAIKTTTGVLVMRQFRQIIDVGRWYRFAAVGQSMERNHREISDPRPIKGALPCTSDENQQPLLRRSIVNMEKKTGPSMIWEAAYIKSWGAAAFVFVMRCLVSDFQNQPRIVTILSLIGA